MAPHPQQDDPRRRGRRAALLALALAAALAVPCAPPAAAGDGEALERALAQRTREARRWSPELAVHVVALDGGGEVYAFEPDRPLIIASNTKLFTSAAALDRLGPDFAFETPVLIRGAVYDGTLTGDLAVVGSGDPNLSGRHHDGDSLAVFRRWGEALVRRGITRVRGDLYLVHGLFEGPQVHPDWPEDQLHRWYEAPVAALSFNDNCVLVRVRPGERPGAPPLVELEPRLPGLFTVHNSARTTAARRHHRVLVERAPGSAVIEVSGAVYQRSGPFEAWVTVPDPLAYFGAAVRVALAEAGVTVEGRLLATERLPGAVWERVTAAESGLLTTLEVINQRSQNFYAESVVKLLGAQEAGRGDWPQGVAAVERFLAELPLDGAGAPELADGSGMSRNNRATARQITELLSRMFGHRWGRQFLLTLPVSGGEEPAWHRRLAEPPYAGNVFAKTGTLKDVSALSGYLKARSGRLYAFSILCNRTRAVWRARRAQDAIVRALVDGG